VTFLLNKGNLIISQKMGMPSNIHFIGGQNADKILRKLKEYRKKPTTLFVYADWCGYCKLMMRHLPAIARTNPGMNFVLINQDPKKSKILAIAKDRGWKIKGYPYLRVYHGEKIQHGSLVKEIAGFSPPMLSQAINTAQGIVLKNIIKLKEKSASQMKAKIASIMSGSPVVIFGYASWCGFCHKTKPLLAHLAKKYKNVKFLYCNQDKKKSAFLKYAKDRKWKINGFPFLRFYKKGGVFYKEVGGYAPKQIVKATKKIA